MTSTTIGTPAVAGRLLLVVVMIAVQLQHRPREPIDVRYLRLIVGHDA
ncbi:hypothetical protein I548_3279 [Mycobacterium intracellulare]|nr:hypothetical protein I548_3279 [Mycobacterium intracellulare]